MTVTSLAQAWAELDVARYKSEFYRQWWAGHHAGLTHPRVLETMDEYARSPTVRELRRAMLAATRRNASLGQVTRQHPNLFQPFEAALLRLGEEAGALEHCLRLLADHYAAEHRMTLWVKQKLSYPMMNAFAACFIAPFPILFFGNATAYLLTALGGVTGLILAGGGILLGVARWYGRKPAFVLARLLRSLTTAIEAGLSIGKSVELAVEAADSPDLAAHVKAQGRRVLDQPPAVTFAGAPGLPREVIAAMRVAETTGDYGETLGRLAALYDAPFSSRTGAPLAFPP